ncbi:coiled-coil domain-containing protein 38 [Oryzias melastigma]|uniref:Coiled-coil domain-containing protein 38-like n=1 Tax=Oryzias melastigma TaxID=30732 RepID=A0A3B3E0I2_ORYME|nr:coiled-coil domain-containing protein 38 [Oryzias melastigma]
MLPYHTVEGAETLRANMSKIPAQNLPGTITKKKKEGKPSGNPQQSDKKEVCSKVKQFLLEEEARASKKRELLCVGRMIGELEILIKNKNADLLKLSEKVEKLQGEVSLLQKVRDKAKTTTEELPGESEEDLKEAQTILENEAQLRCENRALKEGLVKEIKMLQSEDAGTEELLSKYKKYRNLISRLCSRECQEAQRGDTRENQDDQNSELEETAVCKKSPFLIWKNCIDSVRVMLKLEELEDQNLFLIESSTEKNDLLDQTIELITKATEEEERTQTLKVDSMKNKCAIERRIVDIVKKKVDQHNSSATVEQDILLETLRKKVTEVHSCFADAELSSTSTLEKLAFIENHMTKLLQDLEKIPKDEVKSLWQIKEKEKRSRWREEKLRLETEKREEKMRRHAELAMKEPKKITGRKLMQRFMPVVKPKTKVIDEVTQEPEDDLYKDLFSEST